MISGLLLAVFYAIIRLTDFLSDPFGFLPSKTGSTGNARRELGDLRASRLTSLWECDSTHQNCFEETISWCEWWFSILKVWPLRSPPPQLDTTEANRLPVAWQKFGILIFGITFEKLCNQTPQIDFRFPDKISFFFSLMLISLSPATVVVYSLKDGWPLVFSKLH